MPLATSPPVDAFVEGVRSLGQACHLVIIAPMVMLIVAGRGRSQVVAGAVVGVVLGGWIFAARWIVLTEIQLRLSGALVVAIIVATAISTWSVSTLADEPHDGEQGDTGEVDAHHQLGRVMTNRWIAGATSVAAGVMVVLWWRPCVGEQLGEILTLTPDDPWGQLPAVIGFMAAIAVPLVVVGLVFAVWRPTNRSAGRVAVGGAAIGVLLAGSVLVGRHGDVVGKLFEWSQ